MIEQPSIPFIIFAFIAVLGPLVFFHELGHYGVARLFGIKSEAFSIGFGKEVLGWTDKRGTRWKVGWLPLGGYVRFAGDMDVSSRPAPEDQDPDHFQNRPVWQRFLVVLAGPMANFLLAIVIFAGFFLAVGDFQSTSRIGTVEEGSAAAEAGLLPGDEITSIAGRDVETFDDIMRTVVIRPGEDVTIVFERDGETRTTQAEIDNYTETDRFGEEHRIGRLGVGGSMQRVAIGPLAAIGKATSETWKLLNWIVDGIGRILFGNLSIEEMGGPIKMAQISGQQLQAGWFTFITFAALLSINLGFINLLPIPMLDGGHLLFYTIEAIRRKPVGEMAQEWAFRAGLVFLGGLMIFLTINDSRSIGLFERLGSLIG
ncbi:RIP metalloprotease RseP [Sphingomicrobium sediminis]|uniref:Zinc metalloprotease n=1 Tax=Sphingomicrobium sediminis TaxID=2950949 RepID=A0A9X2EK00_9SPHN|nr:RIP metalloprotease RseP [Sphingomicrobium sediminis]MCM8556754.1 RIP metalloprotease RseP [Sphingomicrobium sediminis]